LLQMVGQFAVKQFINISFALIEKIVIRLHKFNWHKHDLRKTFNY
jgi:hypothetical protein